MVTICKKGHRLLAAAAVLALVFAVFAGAGIADESDAGTQTTADSFDKLKTQVGTADFNIKVTGDINFAQALTIEKSGTITLDTGAKLDCKTFGIAVGGTSVVVNIKGTVASSSDVLEIVTGSTNSDLIKVNVGATLKMSALAISSTGTGSEASAVNIVGTGFEADNCTIAGPSGGKTVKQTDGTVKLSNMTVPANMSVSDDKLTLGGKAVAKFADLPDKFAVSGDKIEISGSVTTDKKISGTGTVTFKDLSIAGSKSLITSTKAVLAGSTSTITGTLKASTVTIGTATAGNTVTVGDAGKILTDSPQITLVKGTVTFNKGYPGAIQNAKGSFVGIETKKMVVGYTDKFIIAGTFKTAKVDCKTEISEKSAIETLTIKSNYVDAKTTESDIGTAYVGVDRTGNVVTVGAQATLKGSINSDTLVFKGPNSIVPDNITLLGKVQYNKNDSAWLYVYGNVDKTIPKDIIPSWKSTNFGGWVNNSDGSAISETKFEGYTNIVAKEKVQPPSLVLSGTYKKVYMIGESFDSTGIKVSLKVGSTTTDVTSKCTFPPATTTFTAAGDPNLSVTYTDTANGTLTVKLDIKVTSVNKVYKVTVDADKEFKSVKIGSVELTKTDGKFTSTTLFEQKGYMVSFETNNGYHGTAQVVVGANIMPDMKVTFSGGSPVFSSSGTLVTPADFEFDLKYVPHATQDIKSMAVEDGYKKVYNVGESFDAANTKLKVTYMDNTVKTVSVKKGTSDGYTYTPTTKFTSVGSKDVKFTYDGHDLTVKVTVQNNLNFYKVTVTADQDRYDWVKLNGVALTQDGSTFTNSAYLPAGEYQLTFGLKGGLHGSTVMTVGTSAEADTDMKFEMKDGKPVYGSDGSVIGPVKYKVTLTYTADEAKDVKEMRIIGDYAKEYPLYSSFSPEGMIVTVIYADAHEATVTDRCTFAPERFETVGDVDVSITFDGFTTKVKVKVTDAVNPDISMDLDDGKVSDAQETEILKRIADSKAAEKKPVVTLDAPSFYDVKLSTDVLKALADAEGTLSVSTAKGTAVFPAAVLAGITAEADKEVVVTLKKGTAPENQKEYVGGSEVFEISMTVDGTAVKEFAGSVDVQFKYVPAEKAHKSWLKVVYLKDDGTTEKIGSKYVEVDGKGYMSFETEHFSLYTVKEFEQESGTSVFVYIGAVVGILIAVVVGVIVLKKKNVI